jgi:hypothetical protein
MSESRRHGRCTDDRTGSHQPFPARIDLQVQTFQGARAEQLEIAPFGKDDLIHRLRLIYPKYGIADRARNDLAVRQLKLEIFLAALDPDCLQNRRIDPRGLSPRIDQPPPPWLTWKSPD